MMDEDRLAATVEALRRGVGCDWISLDDRVSCDTAARLLGVKQSTLAKWRQQGTGPRHHRVGGAGHRVSYALDDLAAHIINRCARTTTN